MAGFDDTMASLTPLEVDVEHLENIGTYLTKLSEAITSLRETTLRESHRAARVGGDGSRSALGMIDPEATDLASREQGTYTAVDTSLKTMGEDFSKMAEGIAEMAEKYRTAEERNRLTAAEFSQAMAS